MHAPPPPSRGVASSAELSDLAPLAQWRLLDSAFGMVRGEGAAAFVPAAGAIATYALLGQAWCLIWAAATLAGSGLGRHFAAGFDARASGDSIAVWSNRYAAALWFKAALAGAGGIGIGWGGGRGACVLVAVPIGFTLLRAAMSARLTRVIRGEIVLLAGPLGIGCLLAGSKLALVTGGLFAVQAVAAYTLAGDAVARARAAARGDVNGVALPTAGPAVLPPSAESFQRLLGRDQLTGLPNRHSLMHLVAQETSRAVRAETQLSVLLVAWDGYDMFEAAHEPQMLDATVARIAKRLRTKLRRRSDIIANVGGGRFAVVLAFTDAFGATTVAGNLQEAARTPDLAEGGSDALPNVTLSIGVATYCGKGMMPGDQLFQFAEEALVNARKNGGGRIQRYDPVAATLRAAKFAAGPPNPAIRHAPVLAHGGSDDRTNGTDMERPVIASEPPA
jgi:diguanylate cyclase (GGDEF)-like protein